MKLKGLILILIILMSSFSFCNAESLVYDPVIKSNNNQLPTNTTTNVNKFKVFATSDSSIPDTTMSFEECMDYLVLDNQPTYILITGDVSNPRNARYTISYGKPANFHNIDDNFYDPKFKSLTDPILNGTLFYTPDDDFTLRTQFLTDSDDKIDLVNYTVFKQSIRNTQFIHAARVKPPTPDWASRESLLDKVKSDPVGTLAEVNNFCYQLETDTKRSFTTYQIEANKVYAHNQVVSRARSNDSTHYWGGGLWSIFNDVDDAQLNNLMIQYQTIKEPLKETEYSFDQVILKLDWTIYALEVSGSIFNAIPVIGGTVKSSTDIAIIALKAAKLALQQVKLDKITRLYISADIMTFRITAEKAYRENIRNGAAQPTELALSDKRLANEKIDGQIENLQTLKSISYNRIFNYSDINGLRNNYQGQINYLQTIKDTYDMYGGSGGCPYWITSNLQTFNNFYSSTDNLIALNNMEKALYPTFEAQIDAQIVAISKDKYVL
ncbi:MAG: hypothetical protein LBT10_00415 [Methanobrevibacter sp.]|nr:hypothetical protein [Methanobrevibacter sp.]